MHIEVEWDWSGCTVPSILSFLENALDKRETITTHMTILGMVGLHFRPMTTTMATTIMAEPSQPITFMWLNRHARAVANTSRKPSRCRRKVVEHGTSRLRVAERICTAVQKTHRDTHASF